MKIVFPKESSCLYTKLPFIIILYTMVPLTSGAINFCVGKNYVPYLENKPNLLYIIDFPALLYNTITYSQ